MRFRRIQLWRHSLDVALQRREVRRLIPGVVAACVFLVLVCLGAFIVQTGNDRAALNHATVALRTSVHTRQLVVALGEERKQAIHDACESLNHRHDATLQALDKLLQAAAKRYPKRAVQIRTSRASTVLLINALAPKQDCNRVVQRATS